ncbi:histidine kinase [Mucilaginibacter mali]|uniref:Histidine kinase n=1 Tax=Mucilaginibacter mali TaxID=2740462 RepID=A0A7D4UDZ3_9SPHI|nr:histidine kinase [Mucilaginibacter mali]QKJ28336.1 histidine kinase [Mucilaginibacter mali]
MRKEGTGFSILLLPAAPRSEERADQRSVVAVSKYAMGMCVATKYFLQNNRNLDQLTQQMSGILKTIITLSTMFVFASIGIYLYYIYDSLFSKSNLSRFTKKAIIISAVCFCFYVALMPFYPCYNRFSSFQSYFISLGYHILRSTFFVFAPVAIILYIQRQLEIRNVPLIKQHLVIVGAIFLCLTSTNIWMRLLIDEPDATYTIMWTFMLSMFLSGIVSALYLTITYTQQAQKRLQYERDLEISRLNELKSKAELDALQAKINPHFLYNTLNSIAELSVSQGLKARQMTIALADLFRYSLNKQDEAQITIAEEVEMAENYLLIEKIRFEDRLQVAISVADEVKHLRIPKFILQPLVENAVKHGLKDPDKTGFINISIMGNPKIINIVVHDNGCPFPEDLQASYGLRSVMDKLNAFYPRRHDITFENMPLKQVSITINLG